ncbi:hypothetical protein ACS0TY_018746 [Phlomoides rotata]
MHSVMHLTVETGFLGLLGEKVDAIDYQTAEIERLSKVVSIFFKSKSSSLSLYSKNIC